MNGATLVQLALFMLRTVLAQSKNPEATVTADVAQGIEAAIAKLQEVHGSPVTFAQLESLRVNPTW